ncbi:hypothetical protein FNYG_12204 [Fusarium nygamai]|uniref:NACHT domain-containing protein n=1 Tax=Gibberella nygamai TaxID=42673 RepID=A0A2K0VWR4_GIBNY|nr:hypothetical protein FNYG_12204 [Fusarium nygamai]
MDPISALSVATAVATFIEFAGSLISTAGTIYRSDDGASPDTLKLETIYETLQNLSIGLQAFHAAGQPDAPNQHPTTSSDVATLSSLSAHCRDDCNNLLDIFQKLKVQGDKNRLWKSVKASLKTKTEINKIWQIEKRLERSQKVMSLQVIKILRDQVTEISQSLNHMKWENQRLLLDQASKMDTISRGIQQLKLDIPPERTNTLGSEYNSVLLSVVDQIGEQTQSPGLLLLSDQVKAHSDRLRDVLKIEQDLVMERAILASLDFELRSGRYEAIPEAYSTTYEWAFDSDLSHWLQNENGIFWISGKAGSGKSTLMKFIATHFKTQNLLLDWSSQEPITIASHYFWAAGASIQKSRTGLLRTLLYEVFRQCPKYMPIVCPNRWDRARDQSSKIGVQRDGTGQWSHSELSQALQKLAGQRDLSTKFCFFIDGMDEYNGDHLDLFAVLKEFSTSPHIKLCVSSRPWNVFIDNFGDDRNRMLKIHELTRTDILTFSRGRLESHPRWAAYRSRDEQLQSITQTIADRAQGVFLWAFLVIKLLQDGLTNGDTAQQLRHRLDNLPTSLKRLFKHMLDQVDSCYHEKMAGMFQIALHAQEPLRLDFYGFHDREYEDEDYALHYLVKERNIEEILDLYDETCRRINTWANGLLECNENTIKVDFLHRDCP